MKVFVIDVSGKVDIYDMALCDAISGLSSKDIQLELYCPLISKSSKCKSVHLLNLVPAKYKTSKGIAKRIVKVFELFLNYLIILFNYLFKKPDVVHFQWLPLLEVSIAEILVIKIMRLLSPKVKTVLTIHNVYPHDATSGSKKKYNIRFKRISELFDEFVVHTKITKMEVIKEFDLEDSSISVIHHGIFEPQSFHPSNNMIKGDCIRFIVYGNLTSYKGVDIFIEAIKLLPEEYRKKMHATIAGRVSDMKLMSKINEDCENLNIELYPQFLPEEELYKLIDSSNVIVLPYRQISQSGVLLLALSFRRSIITSDLPPFKETLEGFSDEMFFESENAQSLANLMMRYIDGGMDICAQIDIIEKLNTLYSWSKAAEKTVSAYNRLIKDSK